ncbi:putative ribonuclease H-like domain-containing protein [Tanacetum coccineum]
MPSVYQHDKGNNLRAYAPKIYNDPNMSDTLRDIYRTLESRYVHKGRTIDTSFYNDLSDDSVAKFTAIGFECLISLDEHIFPSEPIVKKPIVETSKAKASADKPKVVRKNNGALIIEDWVSDNEEEDMPQAKIQKKIVKPSFAKIEFVKSKEQYDCNNHQRQFNNKKMVKPVWNYTQRVNHQNFSKMTHPSPKRNMIPKVVLMRSGLVSLTTARPVNTAQPRSIVNSARPMTNVFNKAHSVVRWPINNKTATKNSNFNQRVNTVSGKNVNSTRPKAVVNTAKPKAVLNVGNPQMDLQDQGVIDSGCSRHMTGNMSYLTNFEEIDEGYVAFGGNPKGGKITVSRKNNMYSVDLKNIVPKRGLTCLFAKATSEESKLWHRRLGHINFKTMNKLVKGNLVRGLPSKLFENNQTCVACQKGKQHRASSRTPQQNGVAERKNRTLIEAARTMLADSKLPTTFWAAAVNIACYVQNRVLVTKPHNKTHYELFLGRKLSLGFMRPFGCPVIILNTIDHLGKFDGKANEGFFVGCLINSKAFRLVVAVNQSNGNAGTKACDDAGQARMETIPGKDYILLPLWTADPPFSQSSKSSQYDGFKPSSDDGKKVDENSRNSEGIDQEKDDNVNSTNNVNAASTNEVNVVGGKTSIELLDDPNMPALEDYSIFDLSSDDQDNGAEADMNNLDTTIQVSPIPTTRIDKDHHLDQVIGDLLSGPQTRRMKKNLEEHGLFSLVQQRTNHKDFQNFLFACFLSQEEPKKVIHALKDLSWIEAMQEKLLQFKLQEVWTLVDLPNRKRAIGSKWVFSNKKDERGIVIKNKARLFAQGYTQEEGIDYDKVFAPVVRIEAIRLFLAYALFKDFVLYQMDVKSTFLYGKIEEEVYVCQPLGFEDPDFPDKVYKVEKALYGLHQAPRTWDKGELTFFLGLQVKQKENGIFISQDKYVTEILKKFGFTDVKTASTPMETQKLLLKDEDGEEVDVHLYRSIIGSLMYLTSSRLDIMFAMYPKDSPLDLVAYTDSDYVGASLDMKSTTGGAVTTEEKTQKKNDVKSKSMLLMALPNEHLVTFNQYKDAKILFDAIQTRFGGNDAIKKTQKTLLKQMYKNFNAPSTKSLDSIFNRLQKIVSQLAILGENIS